MLKILQCKMVFLIGLAVLLAGGGCASEKELIFDGPVSPRLVSQELLAAGNLKIVWENKLPISESESVERLFVLGDRIYAISDRNYLVSLDREKGNVIFSRSVAPAGLPVLGMELYENQLLSIIGGRLVELDPQFGTVQQSNRLGFGTVCPAGRNSSYFYLAAADRRMHVLRASDKVKVFEVAAENESMITSIVADEQFVVFATDGGNCISITPDEPRMLWQFKAAGGIIGPVVKNAGALFFASKDTNVYKINVLTGKLVWKYQTAVVLNNAPKVTDKIVYQYMRDRGLAAIDKENGKAVWLLSAGLDMLAKDGGKSYVITSNRKLVVMDNKKGKPLYSVNFAPVSRYATNLTDSKMYIADKTGRIACIRPAE